MAERLQVGEGILTAEALGHDVIDVGGWAGAPSTRLRLDVLADRLTSQLPSPESTTPA